MGRGAQSDPQRASKIVQKSILGRSWAPRWAQDGPRRPQRANSDDFWSILDRFWTEFWPILDRIWTTCRPHLDTNWNWFCEHFRFVLGSIFVKSSLASAWCLLRLPLEGVPSMMSQSEKSLSSASINTVSSASINSAHINQTTSARQTSTWHTWAKHMRWRDSRSVKYPKLILNASQPNLKILLKAS